MLVNGELRVILKDAAGLGDVVRGFARTVRDEAHATETAEALLAREAYEARIHSYGDNPENRVNPQSLVVHWRKKDEQAFAALRDAIAAAI